MENDLLDLEDNIDLSGLFEEKPMDTSESNPLPELGDLDPEIFEDEPEGEADPIVDPEVEEVVDQPPEEV